MALRELKLKVFGVGTALLMHNGQLSDPLNKWSRALKEVSSKRKKADSDFEKMSEIEWQGGLYLDQQKRITIPAECWESCIVEGAKKQKMGKQFKAAVQVSDVGPLEYGSRKPIEELMHDENFVDRRAVRVGTSKVMRTRPIFREWSQIVTVQYDSDLVNKSHVIDALIAAGNQVGIGTYRPRFGRFGFEEVK